jgi:spermidine synthase
VCYNAEGAYFGSLQEIGLSSRWQTAFDPDLDDTEWTELWSTVPIAQVPPGEYQGGYRVVQQVVNEAEVFGRPYRLQTSLDCRFLYAPQGYLWMSDTPQERIMMANNARHSWGHVLVGGLGLGLYPQYAACGMLGEATQITVLERSPVVAAIVEPVLRPTLSVPLEVMVQDVGAHLSVEAKRRYDTIFIDTWESLDATRLPEINRLRDLALSHLAPDGRVLLWGYRWIVRLFEDACRRLLAEMPAQRQRWLMVRAAPSSPAGRLLMPVEAHFRGQVVGDLEQALSWCREYAMTVTTVEPGERLASAR